MSARAWTLIGAVLVLAAFNWVWAGKASIIREGREVYLAMAPIDPRSLMQGDFMALRFALAEDIERARETGGAAIDPEGAAYEGAFGRAPVLLDARGIARLDWSNPTPALFLRYRLRQGRVWLGTNAFFFEEGEVERYRPARFGVFRVDPDSGEAVLVALADQDLKTL